MIYKVDAVYNGKTYPLMNEELGLISPIVTFEVGKTDTFEFSIAKTHENYGILKRYETDIKVTKNNTEVLFNGRVIEESADFQMTATYICLGEKDYLNDSIIPPYEHTGTISQYIDHILDIHNSQVEDKKKIYPGNIEVTAPDENILRSSYEYPNALSELEKKLTEVYGGYLKTRRADGKIYLDYVYRYGNANIQPVRYGLNMLDCTKNGSGQIITRLIPLGAQMEDSENSERLTISSINNGKIYIENETLKGKYGIITGKQEWDSVTDPAILKQKGDEYLEAQILPESFTIKALDASLYEVDFPSLGLGCMTKTISKYHNLEKEYLLISKTVNLTEPENDQVELGEEEVKKSLTGSVVTNQKENETKIEQVQVSANNKINNTAKTITGAKGGYVVLDTYDDSGKLVEPWQILIMDKPEKKDAVNVIRMNQNGIGFSTDGYDGTYRNAWTIDGTLSADFIRTGNLVLGGSVFNKDGAIIVKDSRDRVIGQWDKNGLSVMKGSIEGTSIEVGAFSADEDQVTFGDFFTSVSEENKLSSRDGSFTIDTRGSGPYGATITITLNGSYGTATIDDYRFRAEVGQFDDSVFTGALEAHRVRTDELDVSDPPWESTPSERKFKENIESIDKDTALRFICSLNPVSFTYNSNIRNKITRNVKGTGKAFVEYDNLFY